MLPGHQSSAGSSPRFHRHSGKRGGCPRRGANRPPPAPPGVFPGLRLGFAARSTRPRPVLPTQSGRAPAPSATGPAPGSVPPAAPQGTAVAATGDAGRPRHLLPPAPIHRHELSGVARGGARGRRLVPAGGCWERWERWEHWEHWCRRCPPSHTPPAARVPRPAPRVPPLAPLRPRGRAARARPKRAWTTATPLRSRAPGLSPAQQLQGTPQFPPGDPKRPPRPPPRVPHSPGAPPGAERPGPRA